MLNNFKIALQRQKKLIALFILTILLPSIFLGVFGIRAIRNEKFRLAQQFENEHKRIADFLKSNISTRLTDVEIMIQNLAEDPQSSDKNYNEIKELLHNRLAQNKLVEQAILVYRDGDTFFPLFPTKIKTLSPKPTSSLNETQQKKLKRAEDYEYVDKNYKGSMALYNELFISLKKKTDQAQMLNHIARNLTKQKKYNQAIEIYSRIMNDYPESNTLSGIPLPLLAQLQMIDCLLKVDESKTALQSAIDVYKKILSNSWDLSEDQFETYASMVNKVLSDILYNSSTILFEDREYKKEFEQLIVSHQQRIKQKQIINELKKECIPELRRRLNQPESYNQSPFRFSKTLADKDFLITAVRIPDKDNKYSKGILGVKIKEDYLESDLLNNIFADIQLSEEANLNISNHSGRIIYGKKIQPTKLSQITTLFEDNFPPWKIEISNLATEGMGIIDIQKSFYFWTIIFVLIILSFGVVLIVRTVSHEMELLKIKSDFVSSVSHEFKTPLTSIKALTERLLEGKVKNPAKMKQYFSVISQDTERLTRLVGNILDFSKIEEGKKEYEFDETNIAMWLDQTIKNFRKENIQLGVVIHTQIPNNIPHIKIDKNALAQAFYNLLDNAIKFSVQKNEIEVIVSMEGENVVLKVKDFGIGIPSNELDKIFEKFYQGSNAIKYSAKGTGLGLTLVKHTVEAHGGKISIESKEGDGSTFSLIMPINNKSK